MDGNNSSCNRKRRVSLTRAQSAELNAVIGELSPNARSGSELTAQVKQKLGHDLGEHAIWKRCRQHGHPWPGGTEPRLTPEESRYVDARLLKLLTAGTPGKESGETINREIGKELTLPAYYARFQRLARENPELELEWVPTPKAGRPWAGTEEFPKDQWEACYADPVYEARKGIHNRVVCRECLRKALLDPCWPVALYRDGALEGEDGHRKAFEPSMMNKRGSPGSRRDLPSSAANPCTPPRSRWLLHGFPTPICALPCPLPRLR
jgi:hypothetical protein